MKKKLLIYSLWTACTVTVVSALASCSRQEDQVSNNQTTKSRRPNIVYILADDLGYGDLSLYGSEIPTPHLDALAKEGMLLREFHTSLACSPTRSMLMSGTDNHLAGLGVMSAPGNPRQQGQPGYLGYMNFNVLSLPQLLKDAGYNTYMTGKWHLGYTEETGPIARGFKHSFVTIDGGAHLSGMDWASPELADYRDDAQLVHIEDEDFYTTRVFTERMISYIEADREENKPFFAYLAYTAPHWPLQAPRPSIDKFKGVYDEGWEVIHRQRLARMQELGLLPEGTEFFDDSVWSERWEALSEEDKRVNARRMEIYAAMVSDLDSYVGEFIKYLKDIGEFDNTFIVFSSDNGSESSRRDLQPPVVQYIGNGFDNSFENLGNGDSYVMYGRDWATLSTGIHRRHKATAFQGGISVPAFAWFPGRIPSGSQTSAFMSVMDLLPTFMELAEAPIPGTEYQGRTVHPVQGSSLLPVLTGSAEKAHATDYAMGWELYGHRGIRQGQWKIVWDFAQENPQWLLFNLDEDPGETTDLALERPEKLQDMIQLWEQYVLDNQLIL
jgi:arylsulfatase A-like enzyme